MSENTLILIILSANAGIVLYYQFVLNDKLNRILKMLEEE